MNFKNLLKKINMDLCSADSPPDEILFKRKHSLSKFIHSVEKSDLEQSLPDLSFSENYRVPFPFVDQVLSLNQSSLMKDKDTSKHDAFSSYGVNVFGKEVYDKCIKEAVLRNEEYGFFLNSVHPVTLENIKILKEISGMSAVSFHMSGTEAVLNACRLAKFNTGKKHILKFKDAYHGWASISDLKEISNLEDLKKAKNCAALLLNPLQYLFPNKSIKADALLFVGNQPKGMSLEEYKDYLKEIREICDEKGIILILDEVFLGFRLAYGGCQEYFNIKADMVLYGKTLGGGLPIGVVCGKKEYMNKMESEYPLKFLPNRGTFSAHPLVMLSMNEFLKYVSPKLYEGLDEKWNRRVEALNDRLKKYSLEFKNLGSILSVRHNNLSIYNWILQLYFKKNNLYLGPYGSSRLIFQVNLNDSEWEEIERIIIHSICEMEEDGWFYSKFKTKNEIYLFYIKKYIKETFKMQTTKTFMEELEEQRMDDHKYYHQSKWNQTFHFFSAICFLISEFLIFIDPILAAYISWGSMIPRQAGHFFFEPKGYDHLHNVTHEHKESIKVGYNLFRKRLLLSSVFFIAPIVTFFYSPSLSEMYTNYGYLLLGISAFAFLSRILYLFFFHSPETSLVWATKIITDPINDIKLYWRSPFDLLSGVKYEPGVKV